MNQQTDLFRHTPPFLAQAHRQAAEHARLNPYESHDEREARAAHHLAEAERLEKINEQ